MMSELFKKKPIVAASLLMPALLFGSATTHAALEEIIVTAQKRAESANEIGLSITALPGDKLAEQKLTSLEEITSAVPGLTFATSQQNTPILTLRGVGFNESSIGVYPATSLYVDEIPLPFPAMASHSAYDLERAEVLKGPQGVLFGQNSTGGAINFIAA
ncbi:MAG: TonB-dependent receptor [Pseudomonadales bacterium]|nr:TonB-dependent receptor [Pseudomonadales bacterium]